MNATIAPMNSRPMNFARSMLMKASTNATAISSPTKSAQITASTIAPYTRRTRRLRTPSSSRTCFCPSGASWRSRSSSVRLRSTARPRRVDSTPMIVPTAVSRNTGAIASWMSRAMSVTWSTLHHRLAQRVLEVVDVVERDLERLAVLGGERLVALFLPLVDLRLGRPLVDALHLVVHVHVDVEGLAQRREQVVLVELGVALHRVVLNAGRNFAQLGERLGLQLRVGMRHGVSWRMGERKASGC